jgi:putative exporter of polyketide antibiotics
METASHYFVGSLPPLMAVRWALSNNSWVAVLLIVLVAIILAGVFYTLLRRQASRRSSAK